MDNLDVEKPATAEPAQPSQAQAATEPVISQTPAQPKAADKPARKDAASPKLPTHWGTGRRKEATARVRLSEG